MENISNYQEITDKEFVVIKEISNNHNPSQRLLAKKTGISLGLTNLIIERLVRKGYVKVIQLNRRKLQYILTPKGFAEKAKKSYNFLRKTIDSLSQIKEKTKYVIEEEYHKGNKKFVLIGNGELLNITELVFKDLKYKDLKWRREENNISFLPSDEIIIVVNNSIKKKYRNIGNNIVNLTDKLV